MTTEQAPQFTRAFIRAGCLGISVDHHLPFLHGVEVRVIGAAQSQVLDEAAV